MALHDPAVAVYLAGRGRSTVRFKHSLQQYIPFSLSHLFYSPLHLQGLIFNANSQFQIPNAHIFESPAFLRKVASWKNSSFTNRALMHQRRCVYTSSSSTLDNSAPCNDENSNKSMSTETWLEVERTRPRAPNPYDGTYHWPAAAPDPFEIKRESFHVFMHGKPERFSREFKVFVYGWAMAALLVGLTTATIWVMTPDDFEWVEEERARMERAKRKKASVMPPTILEGAITTE